jgi:hypothetical protein
LGFRKKKKSSSQLSNLAETTKASIAAEQFDFDYLAFKAKADYRNGEDEKSFTMNFRMKKDSIVWASITGLGFEIVRAVFLKDSIFIADRFNKTLYCRDYSYIKDLIKTDVNLHQFQQLLVGNCPYPIPNYKLNQGDTLNGFLEYFLPELLSKVMINQLYRPMTNELKSLIDPRNLLVNYSNHQTVDKKWLPHQVDIKVNSDNSQFYLSLQYSDVKTDYIGDFPFVISSSYHKAK